LLAFSPFLSYNKRKGELMFRIWAKVIQEDHILKQTVYESDKKFTYSNFFSYLSDICTELDVPTPVLLKTHIFNYAKFNHVIFTPRDFMEDIAFNKLVLENIL